MREIIIQTAEEEFLRNKRFSAYEWASLATELDLFYSGVEKYLQAYRIHVAALSRLFGEINWYGIPGIEDKYIPTETITQSLVQLAKLVDPNLYCSAAAPEPYKLIVKAWETLDNPKSRLASHARVGLAPPQSQNSVLPRSQKSIPC